MTNKIYIGIDNGITGSIGIIYPIPPEGMGGCTNFLKTPIKSEQSYTKKKQNISRLDCLKFIALMRTASQPYIGQALHTMVLIERPFSAPLRIKAMLSANRCLEAQLICLEIIGLPYQYVDSKEWQKELLPQGTKGTEDLKKASRDIGIRLFPDWEHEIIHQKDADGMLLAEWGRRKNL